MADGEALSDEELLERLRQMASARYAELVEEQEGGSWRVCFVRSDEPRDEDPAILSAESPDLRAAREALLFTIESS